MVKAALRFLFIIGCGILLWGCATVEPWERGALAQYSMEPDRDPLDTAMAEHVFYTREAAHGGSGLGGGGCGCN